jgi:hypothetical protein
MLARRHQRVGLEAAQQGATLTARVATMQFTPTILEPRGLSPNSLHVVPKEGTEVLRARRY